MIVFINGVEYDANVNAVTAARYRATYGKSVFEISSGEEELNLLKTALGKDDITAGEEGGAHAAAFVVHRAVLRGDRAFNPGNGNGNESGGRDELFDELDMVATAAAAGLPYEALNDFSVFQVFAIIGKIAEIKSGSRSSKGNTYEEYLMHYGISEEQAAEIQRYMEEHPEESE